MSRAKKTIVYVDGENFLFKVADILKESGHIQHKPDIIKFYFSRLKKSAFTEFNIDSIRFYAAKLGQHKETPALYEQSKRLIDSQRRLKRSLTNDGVEFVLSGNVRLQEVIPAQKGQKEKYLFKEKGTDVRLAIDALANACDGDVGTVVLVSSDSDMQPMVSEVRRRGVKVVYVGFEIQPNMGLSYRCDQTILLRKSEIIDAFTGTQQELLK